MSGIVLVFARDGSPPPSALGRRMMARLAHRAIDGQDAVQGPDFFLGHLHFWTTPEETGERQPISSRDGQVLLALGGRLDNREDLAQELGLPGLEVQALSDADLALEAYARWGERCFEHLLGPFAIVIVDRANRRVLCGRDPLGDRTLFYWQTPHLLLVASEPYALLAHPAVDASLDEVTLAQWFAVQAPQDGRTFFAGVRELLPAHLLSADPRQARTWRYWQPDPGARLSYRHDTEYVEHYWEIFSRSVRCRMRSRTDPAMLLSGGLDSTSVAVVAVEEIPRPMRSISYVFDELKLCDEREYIEEFARFAGLQPVLIPCDDAWPLRDWSAWPVDPNRPEGNAYRNIKERVYQTAQRQGVQVMLTGGFSDQLYSGMDEWLADLLAELCLGEAARECATLFRENRRWCSRSLRSLGRRSLNRPLRYLRARRPVKPQPWLTPYALRQLSQAGPDLWPEPLGRRPAQQQLALGAWGALSVSAEVTNANRYGIDLRHPFRDRRLVEFMLSIPAHQFYRSGMPKYILRQALQERLPDSIRLRPKDNSLLPLYNRGFTHEQQVIWDTLGAPDALWRQYVRPDWLLSDSWLAKVQAGIDGLHALVPWICLAVEPWHRSLTHAQPVFPAASLIPLSHTST